MSNKNEMALQAIREMAEADLLDASDEQIRAELIEDGKDPQQVALRVSANLDAVIAEFMRNQTATSKAVMKTMARPTPKIHPALEVMKALIQSAFNSDPKLGAAFRDGKKQSDNDVLSLYDDLVAMGKIKPEEDA